MTVISLVCRVVLATVFLTAAASKLGRRREFEKTVRAYDLVSARVASVIARLLPPLELVCGLALAFGLATRGVAGALAVVLLVFTAAVALNLARGREIDCGCLGAAGPRRITRLTVARNLVLIVAALVVVWASANPLSLDHALIGGYGGMSSADSLALVIATTASLAVISLTRAAMRFRNLIAAPPGRAS